MPVRIDSSSPLSIMPDAVYALSGFLSASGISYTKLTTARAAGLELPTFKIGKRKYVKGSDGITFMEQLAAHQAAAGNE